MPIKRKRYSSLEIQKGLQDRGLSLFSVRDFARIFDVTFARAGRLLSDGKRDGVVNRVKPGLYYSMISKPSEFEVANQLYTPSYISLETALSYHKIIPESVYTITSITTRHTKRFVTYDRLFQYSQINKRLFFGYKKIIVGSKKIIIAEKEKAFLDYLYFVILRLRRLNERADLEKLDEEKIRRFVPYFETALTGRKRKAFVGLVKKMFDI